ncbi:hypothetical protein IW261DRAFT_1572420 [Armillaria novae-zelandiae]|uniref:Uncharacterized protein n=1 Tax=Armillaria novae-zelandiae TaxID=153914 RepID=A0AA39TZR5_9AGAR|nr:hypothetical protein IW261DRAFT_1572420 [Armillaria novae-zelandiae]
MTVIVFPPKPPALSKLVARLERLQSLTLPKSVTEAAIGFWFCEAKDLETLISIYYADFCQNIQFKCFTSHLKQYLHVDKPGIRLPIDFQAETNLTNVDPWDDSPEGDWDKPPNLESLAARQGTLKDAQNKECVYIGLKVECTNCTHHWGRGYIGGIPDCNMLAFPFQGKPEENVDSILAKIDALTLSAAPYGPISAGATTSDASCAQEVEDSACSYVALNWCQLTFDGPETLPSLVASCNTLFSCIEVNTWELLALLKVRATLTAKYRIVHAKLEEKCAEPGSSFGPPPPLDNVHIKTNSKGKEPSWW